MLLLLACFRGQVLEEEAKEGGGLISQLRFICFEDDVKGVEMSLIGVIRAAVGGGGVMCSWSREGNLFVFENNYKINKEGGCFGEVKSKR